MKTRNVETSFLRPEQSRAGITARRAVGGMGKRCWIKQRPSESRRIGSVAWLNAKTEIFLKVLVKRVLTSNRYLIAREFGEPLQMGEQKTAIKAGAPINEVGNWHDIDWEHARRQVRRLQMRIAKAVKENRWNRVKSLQYLLTRSFHAKALAVNRVVSNRGKKTPGVDGALWQGTPEPNGGLF
jgi:uncharacterized protein YPO0396